MKRDFHYIEDPDIKKTINDFYDSLLNMRGKYYNYCTDFFHPKEIEYAKALLDEEDEFHYFCYGGSNSPEKEIIIFGNNLPVEPIDIKDYAIIITILDIPEGIEHSDVLGAILNQGIDRKKIGDIIFDKNNCHIICRKAIGNFLIGNLSRIKNYSIRVVENNKLSVPDQIHNFQTKNCILSSLRVDQFVCSVCNLSRQMSKKKVQRGHVKINYERVLRPSFEIEKHDMVSIRHYGRYILRDITGHTKKNNFKCIIDKFI